MRWGIVAVMLMLAGCAEGGGGAESDLSQAFCADLEAGLTPANLWPRDMEPEDFAADVYGYVDASCPEQFRTNRSLRVFLAAWGYDPDA